MSNILIDKNSSSSKSFNGLIERCWSFEKEAGEQLSLEDFKKDIVDFVSNEDHWLTLQINDPHQSEGAIIQVEKCPWDSEVLGINVGRIRYLITTSPQLYGEALLKSQNLLRREGIEYLLFRSSSLNWHKIHKLEANGFELVDGILNFSQKIEHVEKNLKPSPIYEEIVPVTSEDAKDLGEFCSKVFTVSRFNNDPFLTSEQAQNAYREWGSNIAKGKAADVAFKVCEESQISAFISGKIKQIGYKKRGAIDLIAVGNALSGKATGKSLIYKIYEWVLENDCSEFSVQTQVNNLVACRLYQKCGFFITDSMLTFRWVPGHVK